MQPPQQASAREVGFLTFMEALIFKKNWKKGVIVRSWVGLGLGWVGLGWLSWGEVKLGGGWEVGEVKTNVRFGILRFCRCQKWSHTPRLDLGHQR